jgi:hypothetical protein
MIFRPISRPAAWLVLAAAPLFVQLAAEAQQPAPMTAASPEFF